VPPETDDTLSTLVAMGFPADEARVALRAAFGNPDRAVEYLTTGIPDSVLASLGGGGGGGGGGTVAAPAPASAAPAPASVPPPVAGGADPLAMLRNHPQLNQLKTLVQSNPAALPVVIEQIGRASPALLSIITAHREAFVALLNEPVDTAAPPPPASAGPVAGSAGPDPRQLAAMISSMTPEQRAQLAASIGQTPEQLAQFAAMMSAGGPGAPGAIPPGATVVRLTEAEMAAVDRLISLGFTRNQVIEAYLACDKNEQLAANFLLENS